MSSSADDVKLIKKRTVHDPAPDQNRMKLFEWKTRGTHGSSGQLKNAEKVAASAPWYGDDHQKECDPKHHQQGSGTDSETNDDASAIAMDDGDVGILACGVGLYCQESAASSLGGVCMSLDTSHQRRAAGKHGKHPLGGNRQSSPSLIDTVTRACMMTEYCDCSGFDLEKLEGTIDCTSFDNYCSKSVNYCDEEVELCFTVTTTLVVSGPDGFTYSECILYTKPYQQKVCTTYDTATPSSCNLEFNNEMCQSCETELRSYEDTYDYNGTTYTYSYNQRCFEFDCATTEGAGHLGNSCDRDVATIGYNIVFGDDCSRCLICGLGYQMTTRDVVADFPVVGEYRCDGLELASILGFFDRQTCPQIQETAFGPCGCEPIFYDTVLLGEEPNEPIVTLSPSPSFLIPSASPSRSRSASPLTAATPNPSAVSSVVPSTLPSPVPTASPSRPSSTSPSTAASASPSVSSSASPSTIPSAIPSLVPSASPSLLPSIYLSRTDSTSPAADQSEAPSTAPVMDNAVPCYICGSKDATFVDPNAWIILPDGISKCDEIAQKALASFFSEEYCTEELQPRAERYCECVLPITDRLDSTEPPGTTSGPTAVPTAPSISPSQFVTNMDPEAELLTPEGAYLCKACGVDGTISNSNLLVQLSNGATSCDGLYRAGLAGIFTEEYCNDTVIPLVQTHCGCTAATTIAPSERQKWDLPVVGLDGGGSHTTDNPLNLQLRNDFPTEGPTIAVPTEEPSMGPSAQPSPIARPLVNEILESRAGDFHHDTPAEGDGFGLLEEDVGWVEEQKYASDAPARPNWKSTGILVAIGAMLVVLTADHQQ
jgi:hypothetical protein